MSDRDFVEATPLAFFIVTLEIPGGKRYVLCVNSTFVTLNNLRRFAFFSLAVTPMFEVDGAIYSGLSSRYNFTTEARRFFCLLQQRNVDETRRFNAIIFKYVSTIHKPKFFFSISERT